MLPQRVRVNIYASDQAKSVSQGNSLKSLLNLVSICFISNDSA